jgi:hypothetical protein
VLERRDQALGEERSIVGVRRDLGERGRVDQLHERVGRETHRDDVALGHARLVAGEAALGRAARVVDDAEIQVEVARRERPGARAVTDGGIEERDDVRLGEHRDASRRHELADLDGGRVADLDRQRLSGVVGGADAPDRPAIHASLKPREDERAAVPRALLQHELARRAVGDVAAEVDDQLARLRLDHELLADARLDAGQLVHVEARAERGGLPDGSRGGAPLGVADAVGRRRFRDGLRAV